MTGKLTRLKLCQAPLCIMCDHHGIGERRVREKELLIMKDNLINDSDTIL